MESLIPAFGNLAYTIVAFVAALSIIVAIHEYGHYIVGKWSGIKAETFSIGFGKVLWSRLDKHGTKWQIAALPFGGFVKFLGDANSASAGADEETMATLSDDERRHTMHGAPLWARAATVFAGPAFNFIFSAVLFTGLAFYYGVPTDDIIVDEAYEIPFAEQDLLPGDIVLSAAGVSLSDPNSGNFDEVTPERTIAYEIIRDGERREVLGPWLNSTRAGSVSAGQAARAAGVEVGDIIISVDGTEIFDFEHLRQLVGGSEGKAVELELWRDGEILTRSMTPKMLDTPKAGGGFETRFLIGIGSSAPFSRALETPGIGQAAVLGVQGTVRVVTNSVSAIQHLIAGKLSRCALSGPIGIAKTTKLAASDGLASFITIIAALSTAIGFLNLLPIPVLDGGHLVFHAWEATTGRPPNERVLHYLMVGGLTIMLALMLFATTNDLFC